MPQPTESTSSTGGEVISDYSGFDFRGQWRGRGSVTQVERAILLQALHPTDGRRVLEIGVGFGRLASAVASRALEYVAVDFDPEMLRAAMETRPRCAKLYVEANVHHLPFGEGTFTTEVMVRVYHHLADPGAVARELGRTLVPAGSAVVSYNPKPTIGTWAQDLRRWLGDQRSAISTEADPVSSILDGAFPIFVPTEASFRSTWRSAGFVPETEWGTGLERLGRWVSADAMVRAGLQFSSSFWFASRFVRLTEARPTSVSHDLPLLEESIVCPRCRAPLGTVEFEGEWSVRCVGCGFPVEFSDGILHARYVPPRAVSFVPGHPRAAHDPAVG